MPDYRWDAATLRWRAPDGRFLGARQVREALEGCIAVTDTAMQHLTRQLQTGAISLANWQTGMAAQLKQAHIAAALSAGGGPPLTARQWGLVGYRLREQYRYLEQAAVQIYTGAQPLDGTLLTRSRMYAHSARATFEALRRQDAGDAGLTEERSIRGAQDSCTSCVQEAARGWVPLGTLIPVGARACLSNCHCALTFRRRAPV